MLDDLYFFFFFFALFVFSRHNIHMLPRFDVFYLLIRWLFNLMLIPWISKEWSVSCAENKPNNWTIQCHDPFSTAKKQKKSHCSHSFRTDHSRERNSASTTSLFNVGWWRAGKMVYNNRSKWNRRKQKPIQQDWKTMFIQT